MLLITESSEGVKPEKGEAGAVFPKRANLTDSVTGTSPAHPERKTAALKRAAIIRIIFALPSDSIR